MKVLELFFNIFTSGKKTSPAPWPNFNTNIIHPMDFFVKFKGPVLPVPLPIDLENIYLSRYPPIIEVRGGSDGSIFVFDLVLGVGVHPCG
jgi:hypothetical protein